MNMPYKTSRDYQLLKKLLDEGKEIVCFTDFPIIIGFSVMFVKQEKQEKADIPFLAVVVNMLHFGKITITNGRLKMKCEWLIQNLLNQIFN